MRLTIEPSGCCGCSLCTWFRKYVPEGESEWVEGPLLTPAIFGGWSLERWEKALKELLAALLAEEPPEFEEPRLQDSKILEGLRDSHELGLREYISWPILDIHSGCNDAILVLKTVLDVLGRLKRNEGPKGLDFETKELEDSQRMWGSCMTEDVYKELLEWEQSNKEVTR